MSMTTQPLDPTTYPVMEEVPRFVACGHVWAVSEIKMVETAGEWDTITIVGVRPKTNAPGMYQMIEVLGVSPRYDLGKDQTQGDPSWQWPPVATTETQP